MSRRKCCCLTTCFIVTDDFDRGDNDDPGSKWNEINDDWDIDTFQLVERGNPNSKIITTDRNTVSGRGVVNVNIFPTNGAKYRILVNATSNGSSYQYVEAHCTTTQLILTAGGETRTYDNADGWDITTRPMPMSACLTDGILRVDVDPVGFHGCVWDNTATVDNDRRYAGLMNGGSVALAYDDFFYLHHNLDGYIDPACPDCGCFCEYDDEGSLKRYYPPWKLKLTYYSDGCPSTCCCAFDGVCIDLEWDCTSEMWLPVNSGTVCTVPWPDGDGAPRVSCGGDDRCGWAMDQFACCDGNAPPAGCDPPPNNCDSQGADVFVCYPLAVQWNYNWPVDDLGCTCCNPESPDFDGPCTYYAILTEGVCA